MRSRLGDGWGPDAYLGRQPYFRDYPRLLIYETGVHFIDVFRALLGEVTTVFARIARRNLIIKGEDASHIVFGFESGATAIWDASRYNESEANDPRYTFGELRLDAEGGHVELAADGTMRIKRLGEPAHAHAYAINSRGFGGDCVYTTLRHFVDCLKSGAPFATTAGDYVRVMQIMDACYASAESGQAIRL
jgi:predicted dehydrogenase